MKGTRRLAVSWCAITLMAASTHPSGTMSAFTLRSSSTPASSRPCVRTEACSDSFALHASLFQQQPGTFRSAVTIVPVDVRVLDEHGDPITDLDERDFTILEDGVPQTIRQFARTSLAARRPEPGERPAFRGEGSQDLSPPDHRVFLIVLGRGRLQGPSKGIDALLGFVGSRLLPQDQVAILAYNRATDFTTSHQTIAGVLERFKRDNDPIESKRRTA